jgi:hypothetical protein
MGNAEFSKIADHWGRECVGDVGGDGQKGGLYLWEDCAEFRREQGIERIVVDG